MFLSSLFLSSVFSDIFSFLLTHMYRHITHLETLGLCPAAQLEQETTQIINEGCDQFEWLNVKKGLLLAGTSSL